MRFSLITLALVIIPSVALAGAPNWTGFAGLADRDGDGFPAFVGNSTAASTGYSGRVDCSPDSDPKNTDKHKSVFPGATEIVADGLDQDCNGRDLVLPVSQAAWVLFVKNEYGGKAPSAGRFVYEFDQCTAASGKCEVDKVDGRFRVTDDSVKFMDIYVNGGKVLRNNGQKADGREIVTLEEIGHYRGGSAVGGGGGLGIKAVTKIAEDKAAAAVKVEADERKAGQLALADDILALGEEDTRIVSLVTTEKERAEKAEKAIGERVGRAETYASAAIGFVQKRGVLLEGYGLVGVSGGNSVTSGDDVARNAFGLGAGAGLNLGLDHESGRMNVFVDAFIGGDGGAGPAHSEAIGLEIVPDDGLGFLPNKVGVFGAYSQRFSQANALESMVRGQNPLIGLSWAKPFGQKEGSSTHGLLQVRLGAGPEWVGIAGDEVTDELGFAGRLTIGIGTGTGALKQ